MNPLLLLLTPPHRLQTRYLRAGFFCSTNWQYFAADGRLPYLLETLTYRLLFDSVDSRLGIPAYSSVIPGRFITLNLLKPYSQEDPSQKKNNTLIHTQLLDIWSCVVFTFLLLIGVFFPSLTSQLRHMTLNNGENTFNISHRVFQRRTSPGWD